MNCFCGKTALYQTGHCKDHRAEAEAAMKALGSKKTGNGPTCGGFIEPAYGRRMGPIPMRSGRR